MTSAPAIGFDYRPSRWPTGLLGIVTALALLAIVLSGAPGSLKGLLAAGTVLATALAARRLSRSTVAGVGLAGETWTVYRADRSDAMATLISFRILGTCVLLRLRVADRAEVLVLAADNSDTDLRRRLRMRLVTLPAATATSDS
jgi:toxin CptA